MSQLQAQKLRLAYTRSSHYGGSLPNVNQIGCGLAEFQVSGHEPAGSRGSQAASPVDSPVFWQSPLHSPLDSSRSTRHHGLVERVQRDPRRMVSPLRRYPRHISFTESWGSLEGSGRVPRELVAGRDLRCTVPSLFWNCLVSSPPEK